MLKRIQSKFTMAQVDELNEENYTMPTQDERENPGMAWEDVVKLRDANNAFRGDFHCKLCPRKIIATENDLVDHLQSKKHKLALLRFYKQNASQFKQKIRLIKT